MNRIKELREKNGMSIDQLSKKLKEKGVSISPASISKYEREERNPKIDKWIQLADFFDVSVPYLQGINKFKNDKTVQQHLDKFREAHGIPLNKETSKLIRELQNTSGDRAINDLEKLNNVFESIDSSIINIEGEPVTKNHFQDILKSLQNTEDVEDMVNDLVFIYSIFINALLGHNGAKKDKKAIQKALKTILSGYDMPVSGKLYLLKNNTKTTNELNEN